MRIHYIVPDFYPNETGFAIAFKNFCTAIVERDDIDQIIVYTPIKLKGDRDLGNKIKFVYTKKPSKSIWFIHKLPNLFGLLLSKIYLLSFIKKIKKDIQKNDIIFIESVYLGHLSYILEKHYKLKKIITRIHGSFPEVAKVHNLKDRLFIMNLVSKLDNIGVTTYHYIDFLNHNFIQNSTNNRKYYIIPNTMPNVEFEIVKRNDSKLKILQLGRMDEFGFYQKGFNDVLQAIFYLESTQDIEILQNLEFTFIGSGKMSNEFQRQLNKIKNVKIRYFQRLKNTEVQNEIVQCDLIMLPSRYEGMSMFGTESLNFGKAFIFTSSGGLRDMIKDGYNGKAVRPYDYIQISSAILNFYNDRDLINVYSKNSQKMFLENFTNKNINEHFDVFLKSII